MTKVYNWLKKQSLLLAKNHPEVEIKAKFNNLKIYLVSIFIIAGLYTKNYARPVEWMEK